MVIWVYWAPPKPTATACYLTRLTLTASTSA